MKMQWMKLLSAKRLNQLGSSDDGDVRSPYQRDFDRIVYSSPFRWMQDKTQVFPLAKSDYVRTRLTHSIEVSCVGRSLGVIIGDHVVRNETLDKAVKAYHFGEIVSVACLAHDIGNPPFGHSGEEAIRAWFNKQEKADNDFWHGLSIEEQQDFKKFEGNAQGFRILTRLEQATRGGGLQLTYATLGALTKYPLGACAASHLKSENISQKKNGFFCADYRFGVRSLQLTF